MQKSFLITILLCVLVLPMFFLPVMVLYEGRELYSLDRVYQLQKNSTTTLYGVTYNGESSIPYKRLLIRKEKPEVILVGTSLMLQWRKELFKKNISFINASVPGPQIGNIANAKYFIDELPNDGKKRVMMIALDHTFFTQYHPKEQNIEESSLLKKILHIPGINIRLIYRDQGEYLFSLRALKEDSRSREGIGYSAMLYGNGYRIDGSMLDTVATSNIERHNAVRNSQIEKKVKEFQEIANPNSFIRDDSKIINANLKSLHELLTLAKKRHITVIGFVPPSPSKVQKEMYATSTLFGLKNIQLQSDIKTIFTSHGFKVYDLSQVSVYGAHDTEFFDALHPTDLLIAKAVLYLAKTSKDRVLTSLFDVSALQRIISRSGNDFLGF